MAWQRHNRYWYQSRREGDRVISEYLGSGPFAADLAALVNLTAEEDRHERHAEWEAMKADLEIDRQIDAVGSVARMITAAALIADGYYTHKGQWRRKRKDAGSYYDSR